MIEDSEWLDFPQRKPSKDDCVTAIIQHWYTKGTRIVELRYTEEDDQDFRFMDDGSELSNDWNVIKFSYRIVKK